MNYKQFIFLTTSKMMYELVYWIYGLLWENMNSHDVVCVSDDVCISVLKTEESFYVFGVLGKGFMLFWVTYHD